MSIGRTRTRAALVAVGVTACCLALGLLGASSALAETKEFKYAGGQQEYKVPTGVTSVHVVAVGSQGESLSGAGGVGAIVSGELSVTPAQTLYVEVGGVPFNGGGSFGGGGASDVRTVSIGAEPSPGNEASLNSRLLVAAGGGGGAQEDFQGGGCAGGAGGAAEEKGSNGTSCGFPGGEGGGAGKATEGGAGGIGYEGFNPNEGDNGGAGQLGIGGEGAFSFAGPGGGGLYGGGAGGAQNAESDVEPFERAGNGGGGGGSNLVPAGGAHGLAASGQPASVTFTDTVSGPTSIQQCMKNGWQNYGSRFKNQGQCIKFVETGR